MVRTRLERPALRYLRQLRALLADLPAGARESILQDIEAHIEEAASSGRATAEILESLGEPRALAQASRSELGLVSESDFKALDSGRILGRITLALAVIAAVVVSFFLRQPEGQHPDSGPNPEASVATLLERYGPGVALVTLLPAGLVLLALWLPRRQRRWAMLGVAIIFSVLVFADLLSTGLFVLPAALTAWLSATLPHAAKPTAGRVESLLVRIIGVILLLSPVVLLFSGLMLDSIGVEHIPLFIWTVFSLAIAVGYAMNLRVAHWSIVAYGVLILGVAIFDAGILIAAFWVGGGIALTFGLYGLLRLKPARIRQAALAAS